MKISAIITTAALGLAVFAAPAVAASAVSQADQVQNGDVNNSAIIFKRDGEFFVPSWVQQDEAERNRD
ncbi:MAG: hypothetical protein AAF141_07475 [Pseudomonadota bacterium]